MPACRRSDHPQPGLAIAGAGAGARHSRGAVVRGRAPAPRQFLDDRRNVPGPDVQRPDRHAGRAVRAGRRRRHPGAWSARPVWHCAGGCLAGVDRHDARRHRLGVRRRLAPRRAQALDMEKHFSLWVYLSASPLLWLTITVAVFVFADWLAELSGRNPFVNPVLIAIVVIAALLLAT